MCHLLIKTEKPEKIIKKARIFGKGFFIQGIITLSFFGQFDLLTVLGYMLLV